MDACEAQGVEVPTWSSDGGFVTITLKRPFFKANTIETNGEDNRTSKRDNLRSTTAQVPTKFQVSPKIHYEAVDDLRISPRWMVRDLENEDMRICREEDIRYIPFRHANGDTRKQLLARAKFILTKHESKWTPSQRWRADIIFEFYPELKEAYGLAMELTDIFNTKCVKDVARTKLAKWFNKVEQLSGDAFRTVIDTFTNHYSLRNYLELFCKQANQCWSGIVQRQGESVQKPIQRCCRYSFFPFQINKTVCIGLLLTTEFSD